MVPFLVGRVHDMVHGRALLSNDDQRMDRCAPRPSTAAAALVPWNFLLLKAYPKMRYLVIIPAAFIGFLFGMILFGMLPGVVYIELVLWGGVVSPPRRVFVGAASRRYCRGDYRIDRRGNGRLEDLEFSR